MLIQDDNVETRDHSLESQMDLIMNNFDFQLVADIFKKFEFTYIENFTTEIIPSIDILRLTARTLLLDVIKEVRSSDMSIKISSGRFEAEYDRLTESLSLKFVVEEKEIQYNEGNESIFVV